MRNEITVVQILIILGTASCSRPASSVINLGKVSSSPSADQKGINTPTDAPKDIDVQTPAPFPPRVVPTTTSPAVRTPEEVPVTVISLSGPLSSPDAEISGMAWFGDSLILLPQYPERFDSSGGSALFMLSKSDILDYLDSPNPNPLQPIPVSLYTSGVEDSLPGYEGFEAIAVDGDHIYLTAETKPKGMMSYLISGQIASDSGQVRLDASHLTPISPQTELSNYSDEALLVFGSRLLSIYEINGTAFNPHPIAHLFDFSLQPQDNLAFPNVEFRITDATPPDDFGRFWAIDYFFPGESKLASPNDPLAMQYGVGQSHAHSKTVERLVEFQFSEAGIVFADTPPIQLRLRDDGQSRNWEAIARLEGRGFLLATDKYPETILGFVPSP